MSLFIIFLSFVNGAKGKVREEITGWHSFFTIDEQM